MAEQFPKLGWGFSKGGELLEKWPMDAEGEPVPGAFLKHCGSTDMEDAMLVNMLEAYGIPCIRRFPKDGALGNVVLGLSGFGADLFVPEDMLEDALALISEEGREDDDEQ